VEEIKKPSRSEKEGTSPGAKEKRKAYAVEVKHSI
jgi:hypothetical protein